MTFLKTHQNADGGWGYRPGGMTYVEPTAAVLLAVVPEQRAGLSGPSVDKAHARLVTLERADGGWGIGAVDFDSGWMTAWAVWALAGHANHVVNVERGSAWLMGAEGIRLIDPDTRRATQGLFHIDSSLRGWPWRIGDAAWVQPTALAILALAAAGQKDSVRVREGVAFLADRAVESGGWNIGDPESVGKVLAADIQNTAVALLALRAAGQGTAESGVREGLQFLQNAALRARTPSDLAWALLAVRLWEREEGDMPVRLAALQKPDGSWQSNNFITAIALMATRED